MLYFFWIIIGGSVVGINTRIKVVTVICIVELLSFLWLNDGQWWQIVDKYDVVTSQEGLPNYNT